MADKATPPPSNIQDLINQMVKKIQEMTYEGKTETSITLKQPPMFSGANLIVTGYESAQGEFNISFENLRPEAKALIDLAANRDTLHQALIDKGYTVHMITATTTIEHPLLQADAGMQQREDKREQEKDQKRRRDEEGEA